MNHSAHRRHPALSALVIAVLLVAGCNSGRDSAESDGLGMGDRNGALTGDGCLTRDCNANGAHAKHGSYECSTCHLLHGTLYPGWFSPTGLAVIAPTPAVPNPAPPSFNPVTKTCSSIACHTAGEGSYSYYFPGGDGEPELKTVQYGGYATTPNWYTGGVNCFSCHGNPPPTGVWHSGFHTNGTIAGSNECQFCHADATGANGVGLSITDPALHRNGTVDVSARFTSRCFGCH